MNNHTAALGSSIHTSVDDVLKSMGNTAKVILRKNTKETPQEKHLHLILKGDSIARLEMLQSIVYPPTQTEVVTTALQLFEELIKEYQAGSTLYIQRDGDKDPVRYNIFGDA